MIIHFFSFFDTIRQNSIKLDDNIFLGDNMEKELFQISHEIKNSLSVLKGYMCLFDGSIEKYDEYMPLLSKALNHSIELLNDFNNIGKLNVKFDVLDVNYLLEEVVDLYRPTIISKKINLICNIDDEVYIEGDYQRLKQVFINILENALDAVKDSDMPSINIKTQVTNNIIEITFMDNGYGMDEYTLEKVFKPFYTTKKYGTGLGMYISNKIIDLHNGFIECIPNNVGVEVKIKLNQYLI